MARKKWDVGRKAGAEVVEEGVVRWAKGEMKMLEGMGEDQRGDGRGGDWIYVSTSQERQAERDVSFRGTLRLVFQEIELWDGRRRRRAQIWSKLKGIERNGREWRAAI